MRIQILHFVTLCLGALGLIMGGAHVLELVPKMSYSALLYKEVNSTLYLYYGIFGGTIQVLAILAATALTYSVRGRPGFCPTLGSLLCLVLSMGIWLALVQPVNLEWARELATAPEGTALDAYARLRPRWEWGHVAAFVAWLGGVNLLIFSMVFQASAYIETDVSSTPMK